jgi:5-formyltetrahydrofolate cyclo-ligase
MHSLRKQLRSKRRQLSGNKQKQHSQKIIHTITQSSFYQQAKTIALYLPSDGEVDISSLLKDILKQNKCCYLPIISNKENGLMHFALYHKDIPLKKNCFAILEPVYKEVDLKTALEMDLVLAPLVGFDNQGNRMGMGGGYYDRALEHLKNPSSRHVKPIFIGIAHELQRVDCLEQKSWDISLHAVVTERGIDYFPSH